MSQNLKFLRSSNKKLIDTVKLPYSVIRSLSPLPMKDEGTDGFGQIWFIFENFRSRRPTRLLQEVNRPAERTCLSHWYPCLSSVMELMNE